MAFLSLLSCLHRTVDRAGNREERMTKRAKSLNQSFEDHSSVYNLPAKINKNPRRVLLCYKQNNKNVILRGLLSFMAQRHYPLSSSLLHNPVWSI